MESFLVKTTASSVKELNRMRPIVADEVAYFPETMKALAFTNDFVTASLETRYSFFQTNSAYDLRIKVQYWNKINTYLMPESGDSYDLIQAVTYSPLYIEHMTLRKASGTSTRVLVFKVYYDMR